MARLAMFFARSPMRSSSAGHFQRGHGFAQIHRHGLAKREQLHRLIFDLVLQLIDAPVACDHGFGLGRVAPGDGIYRIGQLGFGKAAHLRHAGGERFELFAESLDCVFGHPFFRRCLIRLPKREVECLCDSFITLP